MNSCRDLDRMQVKCLQYRLNNLARCLKEGSIVTSLKVRISLFPPLDVSKEEIDRAVEIIRKQY
ncbi:hypothetical protein EPN87_00455 [archaeon]|nr:MAG: hypothetical protein EPN87_00455 [archaeon]